MMLINIVFELSIPLILTRMIYVLTKLNRYKLTSHVFFPCDQLITGGYDYKSVRRWTTKRKLGYSLLECDKVKCYFLSLFKLNSPGILLLSD